MDAFNDEKFISQNSTYLIDSSCYQNLSSDPEPCWWLTMAHALLNCPVTVKTCAGIGRALQFRNLLKNFTGKVRSIECLTKAKAVHRLFDLKYVNKSILSNHSNQDRIRNLNIYYSAILNL